jgi:hypothetical protein
VWADPQPGWVENFLESIRGTAEAIGHVAVDDDGPGALEREVQEHADARYVDWWTAAAAVTGDRGLSEHAPPPETLALDERDRPIRQLARMREISYIDAASVDEYDDQLNHLGADPDVIGARIELRAERDALLKRAKAAEAERRREALERELRQRRRAHEHAPGRPTFDGLADKYVDELADSAPKGDRAGDG